MKPEQQSQSRVLNDGPENSLWEMGDAKPGWQPGQSILARFDGRPPPAHQWIIDALDNVPERASIDVGGVGIELLTWGEVGKPGLLLLHGAGAQADWWNVIAPYFADEYRVAAISWSGMGRSDWRETYSIADWTSEALAAIETAQLDRSGAPAVVAHSLGGSALMCLGAEYADRISAGILVDSFVPRWQKGKKRPSSTPLRRYDNIEEALARYRLMPEQGTDYPEIVDYIARRSLRAVQADADGPAGWTWRFDPSVLASLDLSSIEDLPGRQKVPIGVITGAKSTLMRHYSLDELRSAMPICPIAIAIPEAQHHVMIDQPLALISALRATLQALDAIR